jgi:hypothetical protein
MPQLSGILAGILRDVATARFESDMASAKLVDFYRRDPVLQCFPVPRVEIKSIDIHLKCAFLGDEGGESSEVVVDARTLGEMREQAISGLDIEATISNYDINANDAEGSKILVERE